MKSTAVKVINDLNRHDVDDRWYAASVMINWEDASDCRPRVSKATSTSGSKSVYDRAYLSITIHSPPRSPARIAAVDAIIDWLGITTTYTPSTGMCDITTPDGVITTKLEVDAIAESEDKTCGMYTVLIRRV